MIRVQISELHGEFTCFYCSLAAESINPQPTDQTAVVGELAFFQCQYTVGSLLPVWKINGVDHLPSNLPANHWINSSGLIVRATEETNGTSYQCVFTVFLAASNAFLSPASIGLAYLTVNQSNGEIVHQGNLLSA